MMALTVGIASNQQWDVASQQLIYSVVFFLLLYLIEHNNLALDNYLRVPLFDTMNYDGRTRSRQISASSSGTGTNSRGLDQDGAG